MIRIALLAIVSTLSLSSGRFATYYELTASQFR